MKLGLVSHHTLKAKSKITCPDARSNQDTSTGHNLKWDHFDILAKGRSDTHCKIKEPLLRGNLRWLRGNLRWPKKKSISHKLELVAIVTVINVVIG